VSPEKKLSEHIAGQMTQYQKISMKPIYPQQEEVKLAGVELPNFKPTRFRFT